MSEDNEAAGGAKSGVAGAEEGLAEVDPVDALEVGFERAPVAGD